MVDRQISARGGTDFISRLPAKHLADRLGQQVFVEDRVKSELIEIAGDFWEGFAPATAELPPLLRPRFARHMTLKQFTLLYCPVGILRRSVPPYAEWNGPNWYPHRSANLALVIPRREWLGLFHQLQRVLGPSVAPYSENSKNVLAITAIGREPI